MEHREIGSEIGHIIGLGSFLINKLDNRRSGNHG